MRFDFKQIMMIIFLSYGLLFAFSAVGLLGWVATLIPITGGITVNEFSIGFASLFAIMVVGFMSTLLAFAISEGFENKKFWGVVGILAVVSVVIWILLPQFLPKELQFLAGQAQSLFTGSMPTQALMMP